jgi:hypothetical protein
VPGEPALTLTTRRLTMGTLLAILAVLFLALIIIVPLVEKYAPKGQTRDYSKITRWIIPLMALVLVLQLFRHYFM